MSFTATGKVKEGDIVTQTTFNQIRDNIYAVYDALGNDVVVYGAYFNAEHSNHSASMQESILTMFHRYRWLAYGGTGKIVDASGIGSDISLSDPDTTGATGYYDLESINWMTYGMVYRVVGIDWAGEVDVK